MAAKGRSYQVSATPITIFAHLLVIAVTTLVLVWLLHEREGLSFNSDNKLKILNVHTLLMIIGFILIGGEAIMAYKSIPAATRKTRKMVHLILHLVALTCGILGIYATFKFHKETGIPHMFTLHSWLGIITICLYVLQWVIAFFSYVFPGAELSTRAYFLPWHAFIGLFIFLLAICTAETGLLRSFLYLNLFRDQEALIVNFIGLLLILFAFAVVLSVILPRGR